LLDCNDDPGIQRPPSGADFARVDVNPSIVSIDSRHGLLVCLVLIGRAPADRREKELGVLDGDPTDSGDRSMQGRLYNFIILRVFGKQEDKSSLN
jgi:hypothetical protein